MGSLAIRLGLITLGLVFVCIGFVGAVLPGVPTTGPMVMATACFARSSSRLERWVLRLPLVGKLVEDHRQGIGMPLKAKVIALVMMTSAGLLSVGYRVDILWVQVLIVALIAVGACYIVFRIPTAPKVPRTVD